MSASRGDPQSSAKTKTSDPHEDVAEPKKTSEDKHGSTGTHQQIFLRWKDSSHAEAQRFARAYHPAASWDCLHLFGGVNDGRELLNYKRGSRPSQRDRHLLPVIGCTTQIGYYIELRPFRLTSTNFLRTAIDQDHYTSSTSTSNQLRSVRKLAE
ncbi:hypothetical protein DAPPUDRAFT_238152 [Daphnia pulex]|uniref:Uncharacterized protein n=1 Tax=Daphnia pulex TaxID=6669 RepID=E9G6S5_DAPPU|nr:hypothetical protein DAPPUDRAFT_238152 [Daphnia pulex]|eukprot:EFX84794.1 hypothetical protein DAPPUDRAFT_238152 [Daphnia pulex]